MSGPAFTDEQLVEAVEAFRLHGTKQAAADLLGVSHSAMCRRLKRAAERGFVGTAAVLPGFRISQTAEVRDADGAVTRSFVQQKPERGEAFEVPAGQKITGLSALVDEQGREIVKWVKTAHDKGAADGLLRALVDELKTDLPRVGPVQAPRVLGEDLLNQFTITDNHFGMLSWREETGVDYDLAIAERVLTDWFAEAVRTAPHAHTAILAQLGDLMHHDAFASVTPEHGHVLDADSRLQKVIRAVIRVIRRVILMLLETHQHVHVVMCAGNHDPASSAWMRELLAVFYEEEPRVSIDNSPSLYYAFEWGRTALFYHHGHKRGLENVDAVFAGLFREMYGRTTHAYGHIGHLHNNGVKSSNLMTIERHETLAAPDAYAAGGGWLSGRSAKVITYSKKGGEVFRSTLYPGLVA